MELQRQVFLLPDQMVCLAYTDGASRGNPGDSGIGLLVKNESGELILSENGYIGTATNNIAEYTALLALLNRMKTASCSRLIVHSDSELMVRQLNGQYSVKDAGLKKYYQKIIRLRDSLPFDIEFHHIPREQNKDADRLANLGIDDRKKIRV